MKAQAKKTKGISRLSPHKCSTPKPADSGETCFVRIKLERPAADSGLSKQHPIVVAHLPGVGAGIAVVKELTTERWIRVRHFAEPQTRCAGEFEFAYSYAAYVYRGEMCDRNLEEMFFFLTMPREIPAKASVKEKQDALWDYVDKVLIKEEQEMDLRTAALVHETLQKSPPRFPHEQADVDHYANQRQVVEWLLRKQWPLLFAAMDERNAATTEAERAECQKQI